MAALPMLQSQRAYAAFSSQKTQLKAAQRHKDFHMSKKGCRACESN